MLLKKALESASAMPNVYGSGVALGGIGVGADVHEAISIVSIETVTSTRTRREYDKIEARFIVNP